MPVQQQIAFDFEHLPAEPAINQPLKKPAVILVEEEPAPVEPIEVPVFAAAVLEEDLETIEEVQPVKTVSQPAVKKSTRGRKSMEELSASVDLVQVPPDEELFKKLYYPIGQVAAMFNVNQSLIRLWENEFDALKPRKNGKGDRLFRPQDVKTIQLIYHLTRERKYTMQGAKDFIKKNKKAEQQFEMIQSLNKLKAFLLELKAGL